MDKAFREMRNRGLITVERGCLKFLKWQAVSVSQLVAWQILDRHLCLANKMRLQNAILPQGLTQSHKDAKR